MMPNKSLLDIINKSGEICDLLIKEDYNKVDLLVFSSIFKDTVMMQFISRAHDEKKLTLKKRGMRK